MMGLPRNTSRRGVTLVELIVVVTIMTLLLAITVPALRPLSQGRRGREAARAVNMYIGSAQVRAVEIQRPCGVALERFDTSADACVVLRQVEVPPPYAGDFDGSRMVISNVTPGNPGTVRVAFPMGEDPFTSAVGRPLVGPGDELQLDYKGHRWEIVSIVPASGNPPPYWTLGLRSQTTIALPGPFPPPGVPFQFFRQPVSTSAAPLRLPRDTVIDLNDSGYTPDDPSAYPFQSFAALDLDRSNSVPEPDMRPVMILFAPNGSIQRVYHSFYPLPASTVPSYGFFRIAAPIYLMIGKWERTGDIPAEDGLANWEDAANLWLAINPQSGLVTVAEMYAPYQDPTTGISLPGDPGSLTPPERMVISRSYARQAQISKGGR